MKPSFLKIFQEVKTKDGVGILVSVETPHNGLYVEFDRAKATVWYGTEKAVERNTNGVSHVGRWISIDYYLKDLEEWNKDLKLDNILVDLGI